MTTARGDARHPPAGGGVRPAGPIGRLPLGPGDPRGAAARRRGHRPDHRLPHPAGPGGRRRGRRPAHRSGESVYRRCATDDHHHHLVCRQCGKAVEIAGPAVETWAQRVAAEHGFTDLSHTVEIFGLCRDCGATRSVSPGPGRTPSEDRGRGPGERAARCQVRLSPVERVTSAAAGTSVRGRGGEQRRGTERRAPPRRRRGGGTGHARRGLRRPAVHAALLRAPGRRRRWPDADPALVEALWTGALVAYARCFSGRAKVLTGDHLAELELDGDVGRLPPRPAAADATTTPPGTPTRARRTRSASRRRTTGPRPGWR